MITPEDNPIVRQASYTITYTIREKDSLLNRTNKGFSPIELIGILELAQQEIMMQLNGTITPDIIERHVIK